MISFGVQIDSRKEKVLRPCRGMYIVFEKRGKVLFPFPVILWDQEDKLLIFNC
jgi:hypothetical protein